MLPVTVYPDGEAALIDYLLPLVTDAHEGVTIDVRGGGGHHIRVRRVGGLPATPAHDQPTLDVMVWHDDDRSRMDIARDLHAWVRAANNDRAGVAVITYASTILGPRQMPDPADNTQTVCMFTVSLLCRRAS